MTLIVKGITNDWEKYYSNNSTFEGGNRSIPFKPRIQIKLRIRNLSYNARPDLAKRWAEENPCFSPDLWVEMIPFQETRTYVRRVLFYTRVFEDRLGQSPRPLRVTLSPYTSCGGSYTSQIDTESPQQLSQNGVK